MIIVDMKLEHLSAFRAAKGDVELDEISIINNAEKLLESEGYAVTFMSDGGEVIGCGGLAKFWDRRYQFWAILSENSGPYMLQLTRAAKRGMQLIEGRVEAAVKSDFVKGHKWCKAIGLKWHHHEEVFFPDGSDADVYVRIL